MKYLIIIICVLLCVRCSAPIHALKTVEGEYFFSYENGEFLEELPSITFYLDSTFEYVAPGLGGPYHSKGKWQIIKEGIKLSTQYSCIGANVERLGICDFEDSIDVFISFLDQTETANYISINKTTFILDSFNHFRTTANVFEECDFVSDGFNYYNLCPHCNIVDGNQYNVTIVDNPYYPIINNEVWTICNDGAIERKTKNNTCKFIKKVDTVEDK